MTQPMPRYVTNVLVEEGADSVTVTWGLGEVIPGEVEFFGYGIDYYGPDGDGGKRLGVRFGTTATAHIFEWASGTQANYEADSVTLDGNRLIVSYRDAGVGLLDVGAIHAFSHLNGNDVQSELSVTLLR